VAATVLRAAGIAFMVRLAGIGKNDYVIDDVPERTESPSWEG